MSLFLKIKKTWIFRKLSSVQTAVPLLLLVATVVSYGTIIESRYNSEYARLVVYDALWFQGLLVLLSVNILFAALSRIPYKIHHTGFVITHIGLLTLMSGAAITKIWGIDGQLSVAESTGGRTVMLTDRILEIASDTTFKKVYIPRKISPLSDAALTKINDQLPYGYRVNRYAPFVRPAPEVATESGITVQFNLQSAFFNQSVFLNSVSQPELQMGPATLRLVKESKTKVATPKGGNFLSIVSVKDGTALKQVSLADFKKSPVIVNGVNISLKNVYARASITNNKISDSGEKNNPALEIVATKDQKTLREVLYAKFPTFSLNQEGLFGLRLTYVAASEAAESSEPAQASSRRGNVIEFHYAEPEAGQAVEKLTVKLYKNESPILNQTVKKSDVVQTPWMGMKITLEGISVGGGAGPSSSEVTEIEAPMKTNELPPSAIYLSLRGKGKDPDEGVWLVEGRPQKIQVGGESAEVYYGRDYKMLPFTLSLEKFYKKDYPGTETAISFESHVKVNGTGSPIVISMNEPLKLAGYTLYQSSFDMRPGQPTISIFSVNNDPGRWVKYVGSIILSVGIIIFTYMRSRFYKLQRGSK